MASNKPVEVSANGSTTTVQHHLNDDAYFEQIAQYKGKPYYEYLLNNPWLYSKQGDFVPSFFQRIGEDWFNDYSARNTYYSSILSNQNQWLSEALERFRQEDYNSPIEQVARQRAAGLNPDLNGNVDSGSAAENDQPLQSVEMPIDSAVSAIPQIGQTILTTAFQIYSGFQSARSVSLDNELKSLQVSTNYQDSIWDVIKNGFSSFLQEQFDTLDSADNTAEVMSLFEEGKMIEPVTKYFKDRIRNLPYSSKQKRKMLGVVDTLIYGTDSVSGSKEYTDRFSKLISDSFRELNDSRSSSTRSAGQIGANLSDTRAMKFIANEIYRPLNYMAVEIENLKSQNEKGYYSKGLEIGLGSSRALAEHAGYSLQADLLNVKKRLTDSFKAINRKILGSSELSPTWKVALQGGLAAAEGFTLSKLMHF